jgi:hypothetical protein
MPGPDLTVRARILDDAGVQRRRIRIRLLPGCTTGARPRYGERARATGGAPVPLTRLPVSRG